MKNQILLLLMFPLLFASCVSSKKYDALSESNTKTLNQLAEAKNDLKNTKQERDDLQAQLKTARTELNNLKAENEDLKKKLNALNTNFSDVNQKYSELLAQNERQLQNASNDAKRLNEALSAKQRELEEKAKTLEGLETSLNTSKTDLTAAQEQLKAATKALEEREKRLNEMEAILKQQQDQTEALRKTVNNALLGFQASDLTVEERNGKVYVSLSQNLLFASGSTVLDKKGSDAIKKLAQVLIQNPDIDITVEGHTDNVPFTGRDGMKDNWDLSVLRSTSLIRELVKNGVNTKQITAAGRGEFFPVADNATKEGKAKNRRIEIILSPKLDELFNLIKK
jgi:chemotaxis protein MotB